MYILGKIIGGVFGALIAGPVGLIIGILVGHYFDKGLKLNMHVGSNTGEARSLFFQTIFQMMGYLAKADGRVTEKEIHMARQVMDHLQLNAEQKMRAIGYFNEGKTPEFEWEPAIDRFVATCGYQPQLVRMFVEILLQAAFVDGALTGHKRECLMAMCAKLHIPPIVLEQIERQYFAEQSFRGGSQYTHSNYRSGANGYQAPPPAGELQQAYNLLGISKSASNDEVKKAYRRLMSQNHPDKLVAKGLPEEMIKLATEKTQKIQKAYEWVSKARGM